MSGGFELWLYRAITRMAGRRLIDKLQERSDEVGISTDRFQERLGVASQPRGTGQMIWFHARDAIAALPLFSLIEQLNEQELGLEFLVTTRRHEKVGELLDQLPENTVHQFKPIDLDQPIQAFLKYWSPDILIVAGGELWPNMLTKLDALNVPLIAINTRMTEKSYRRWRWVPGLAKTVINAFDLILAQDQQVAQKLKRLGVQSGKIRVTGVMSDTKKLLHYDETLYSGLSSAIGNRSVWLSAPTHRDEEDVVVNAHKLAMRRNRGLMLILLTREEKRGERIAARHENKNLTFAVQDIGEVPDETTDVYVSDQLENLATYLRLATVTFCGGTLSNGETIDPFHPASMGSAIIHGPTCGEYEGDFDRYSEVAAARLVLNGGELAKTINEAIAPDVAASMAHAAWDISSEGGEVSGIVISEILEKLAEGVTINAAS